MRQRQIVVRGREGRRSANGGLAAAARLVEISPPETPGNRDCSTPSRRRDPARTLSESRPRFVASAEGVENGPQRVVRPRRSRREIDGAVCMHQRPVRHAPVTPDTRHHVVRAPEISIAFQCPLGALVRGIENAEPHVFASDLQSAARRPDGRPRPGSQRRAAGRCSRW